MNQQIRNKVNLLKVEPRPSNDNILAQFLGGIGGVGQGIGNVIGQVGQGAGEAIGQAGTGIAGGIGQGVNLIGQGIGEMNKTPEGRLALRELVGAALRGVGQEDLGVGVQQFAQRVYTPEAQRALFETQQKAEIEKEERKAEADAEKSEKERQQKLIDDQRKRQQRIEDALFLDLKKKEQDPKEARFNARKQASHELLTKFESAKNPYYLNTRKFFKDQKLPYLFKSDEYKQIEQAQRDFVNAVLREESGAAISESEFENAIKQYFPQPGDTAEVVKQKQINRQQQFSKTITDSKSTTPKVYNPQTGEFE
jgi:hypothetical protein